MLKSELILEINQKYKSLSLSDTEKIIELFFNKISNGLYKNYNIEILDLSFLSKGTYILKVDGYLVKKLIKN